MDNVPSATVLPRPEGSHEDDDVTRIERAAFDTLKNLSLS